MNDSDHMSRERRLLIFMNVKCPYCLRETEVLPGDPCDYPADGKTYDVFCNSCLNVFEMHYHDGRFSINKKNPITKQDTHIVIKREDALKYLTEVELQSLESILSAICEGRSKDGKEPFNIYLICNTDEPYAATVHGVIIGGESTKKNSRVFQDKFKITTGKDLLDSGVTKFEVCNGAWIGEIGIRNNRPHLYCKDYSGNLVNSFSFGNATVLDLIIKPISYGERRIK